MFELPLTAEEEYWIGYLRADGSIGRRPTCTVLQFSQKHVEPVAEFVRFLGVSNKIRECCYATGYGRNKHYRVSVTKGAKALDRLGVKTELYAPLYASKHFWRGLLDGDGSVFMAKTRSRNPLKPTLAWSGSFRDMTELSFWLSLELQCPAPAVTPVRSIYKVALGGRKARYAGLMLYKGAYSALRYKREAALSFANWEPTEVTSGWDRKY